VVNTKLLTLNLIAEDEYIGPILVCKDKSQDGLNLCLARNVENLRPRLAAGIPEIDLPPMDPFHLDTLDFKQGSGQVVIKAQFKKITIRHLANFSKAVFKINPKTRVLTFDLATPRCRIDGTYSLSGKILLFAIGGAGPFWFDVGEYITDICTP
jgi:hypothetical protein